MQLAIDQHLLGVHSERICLQVVLPLLLGSTKLYYCTIC